MGRNTRTALLAVLLMGLVMPAFAQTIPAGQSCGGLLCDMGVFGHKVPVGQNGEPPSPAAVSAAEAADPHRLPCHDFLCRAFGQKEADAAPPPPSAVAPVEAAPVKQKAGHRRRATVAARTPTPIAAE